jgi:uncharacterized protein YukE
MIEYLGSLTTLSWFIIGIIFILFLAEILYFYSRNKSIKSTVTVVGVLGTFMGVTDGLIGFDYKDVLNSLPNLLGGLTTAFATSVAGMFAFLILTIVEKIRPEKEKVSKDAIEKDILEKILSELQKRDERLDSLEKLNGLNKLETIEKLNSEILEELQKKDERLDSLEKLNDLDKLQNIESAIKKSEEAIFQLKDNQSSQNKILIESFGKNFENMNSILDKTFEKISEGASKEIIQALQQVIQDFNNELTTQFGENFKELNKAVSDLITWQENYKTSIEVMESNLKTATSSIQNTDSSLERIASRNSEIVEVYEKLKDTVETYRSQIDEVNRHLETYSDVSEKAKEMFPNIDKNIREIKDNFNMTTSSISAELGTLISDIDSSITQNGEKITNTLNHVSISFEDQKTQIAEALQKQADSIIKISDKLPEELANFENSFEAMTKTFLNNYSKFIENSKELMGK